MYGTPLGAANISSWVSGRRIAFKPSRFDARSAGVYPLMATTQARRIVILPFCWPKPRPLTKPDEGAQDEPYDNRYDPEHTVPAVRKAQISDAHGNHCYSQEYTHRHPLRRPALPAECMGDY